MRPSTSPEKISSWSRNGDELACSASASSKVSATRPTAATKAQKQEAGSSPRSFILPIGTKLFEVGPKVAELLLVLDCKQHHRAWDLACRVADEFLEGSLVPGDAGIFQPLAIHRVLDRACFAAVQTIEDRPDLVLRVLADAVARLAFRERRFTRRNVLSQSGNC